MVMAREIRSTLRQSAESDDLDCSSPLAAALTHAICRKPLLIKFIYLKFV